MFRSGLCPRVFGSHTLMEMNLRSVRSILVAVLLICFALRFQSLGTLAIFDPSEGRYAIISQQMEISGDYVTPVMLENGEPVPFLGKPPLFFWLTSTSFSVLGTNEFTARLPSFIASVLTCLLIFVFAVGFFNAEVGILSCLLLFSSGLFFFFSASCMIDPLLALSVTAAYVSFAFFTKHYQSSRAQLLGYGFFLALALGFLTKGPIALGLVVVGLIGWLWYERKLPLLLKLPWVGGLALCLVVVTPWFVLAEINNPGFLKYFFVHENFLRFLVPDYGDKYGSGHPHPYGTIWLMLFGGFFPATLLLAALWWTRRAHKNVLLGEWLRYCLFWGISPAVFFSFGKQVSFSYVLPGLPGLAIFTAGWFALYSRAGLIKLTSKQLGLACGAMVALLWGLPIVFEESLSNNFSPKLALQHIQTDRSEAAHQVAFFNKIPYSAVFYSRSNPSENLKLELLRPGTAAIPGTKYLVQAAHLADLDPMLKLKEESRWGDWLVLVSDTSVRN